MMALAPLGATGQPARSAAVPAPTPLQGPLRVGDEVMPPVKLSGDKPEYTEAARQARVIGAVILEAVIDEHGAVNSPRILKGLPMGLDGAALEAVKTWRYRPATLHGEPVPVYFVLTVSFKLAGPFDYGPAFAAFLGDNPEVATLVHAQQFREAGELLDRWAAARPHDIAIPLARAYVYLGEWKRAEAWQLAQSIAGPEQSEVLRAIAAQALDWVSYYRSSPAAARAPAIATGFAAISRALERNADDADALRLKARLLHEQASVTGDLTLAQALRDEAKALASRADALDPAGRNYP
jgi:TonB family protein